MLMNHGPTSSFFAQYYVWSEVVIITCFKRTYLQTCRALPVILNSLSHTTCWKYFNTRMLFVVYCLWFVFLSITMGKRKIWQIFSFSFGNWCVVQAGVVSLRYKICCSQDVACQVFRNPLILSCAIITNIVVDIHLCRIPFKVLSSVHHDTCFSWSSALV